MEDPDKMVSVNMKIPEGAKAYLLALADAHGATVTRKGRQIPSIQALCRMLSAGAIKTVKGFEPLTIMDKPTYPYSRGKAKKSNA